MTSFRFSEHSYPDWRTCPHDRAKILKPPVGKYLEILKCAMEPHEGVRQIDLCCGLGFGKTLLLIQIAVVKLDQVKGTKILFLEPDWDRVDSIFLETWMEHVPPELYKYEAGKRLITWLPTGNTLRMRPRILTGSKDSAKDKRRGPEYTDVLDDETAIGFDMETFTNTLARIRAPGPCKCYITATTPKTGPYGRFLKRGGNIIFRGRTADNHYLLEHQPDYEINLRRTMGIEQARRELDGELVALEGRIWKAAKYSPFDPKNPGKDAWPNGNRNDIWTSFRKNEPWGLLCDFGSSTGSYVVVQGMPPHYRGRQIYDSPKVIWTAMADLCPDSDASASRAFQRLKLEYGTPKFITGGNDINRRSDVDGSTIAILARKVWGQSVDILPCDEDFESKRLQMDSFNYLLCSAVGAERHFTIARDFVSLDTESKRGLREMLDEDVYMPKDKRRVGDVLPKNPEIDVQHVRDAVLMGTVMKMSRPSARKGRELAA